MVTQPYLPIDREAFDAAVKPVIKYLNDHHHPHVTVIITPTGAELMEGLISTNTMEFVKD